MSLSSPPLGASAPGKLMLCGEYAVLDGAPAIVAAIQRRAVARLTPKASHLPSPEVIASRREAEIACGPLSGDLDVDVNALYQSGFKLGIGSSAAGAVAAAGAVFAAHGFDISDATVRHRILRAALDGHHAVAPLGSGADVAASVLGGSILFRRRGTEVQVDPVRWPKGLICCAVWTGREARTSDLVRKVRALGERDPEQYAESMDELHRVSKHFARAFQNEEPGAVVEAAKRYERAMAQLGEVAGIAIVDERLERIAGLAQMAGGSAKPSGAGGGDVAVAFFTESGDAERFEAHLTEDAFTVLDAPMGGPGVTALESDRNAST